jgi:hypothetical protein
VSRLSAMLTRLFGDSYFTETATLTTQAGLDLLSLPNNFAQLHSIHWMDGAQAYELWRADVHDYEQTPRAWSTHEPPTYRIESSVIRLVPAPMAAHLVRISYTTGLFITSLTDSFPGQIGWDEWLILDVCEMIRDREDKDATRFTARKMEIERQIKDQATQRDRYSVTQVRDVRGELDQGSALFRNRTRFGRF